MQPNEYALLVKDNERRCANLALADNNQCGDGDDPQGKLESL